jgi:hypothetical protein
LSFDIAGFTQPWRKAAKPGAPGLETNEPLLRKPITGILLLGAEGALHGQCAQ